MKKQVLLGIFLALSVIVVNAGKEDEECLDELQLDRDDINNLRKLKPLPKDNPSFSSYLSCLYRKKGVITKDGFEWDKFSTTLFEDIVELHKPYLNARRDMLKKAVDQIVNTCKDKDLVGPTQGYNVVEVMNCVQLEMDNIYARYHKRKV